MIDALVTGRSIAALLAALDLAEVGLRVGLAADERVGEPPVAPVRDPDGIVTEFLNRVAAPIAGTDAAPAAGALPRVSAPVAPLLQDRTGAWAPQATPAVLGIPASPLATEAVRLLGTGAAIRAYLDRIMPLLAVGKAKTLGPLVRKRVGARALERLIEPEVRERYGVGADEVEVALAAPGLNEALSRVGSLTGAALAYSDRNVARETRVEPAGGGTALKGEILRKLALYGAEFFDGRVTQAVVSESLGQGTEPHVGSWLVTLSDGRALESRSLILDFGRNVTRSELLSNLAPGLVTHRVRVHAEIDISDPDWLTEGQRALAVRGGWTILVEYRTGQAARAILSSDVLSEPPTLDGLDAVLSPILLEYSLQPLPSAEWSMGVAAAPFSSHADRDQAASLVANIAEQRPPMRAVGRSLFGDDLPSALAAAHADSVALRRDLTGLTA